jgi:hypothetical protein
MRLSDEQLHIALLRKLPPSAVALIEALTALFVAGDEGTLTRPQVEAWVHLARPVVAPETLAKVQQHLRELTPQ